MNKDTSEQKNSTNSEEIDLIVIFNVIGNAINKVVRFITSIFLAIFSVFIHLLKAIIVNFKIIAIVVIIASLMGYGIDKIKPETYRSSMLVKPYFDSKYQLVNSVDYYNALLANKDHETLSKIFTIDVNEAKEIVEFKINAGPETENERILQYDNFIRSIDSVRAQEISLQDFVDNRSIYSSDIFEIEVTSYKNDIFPKLEAGLGESFTNLYSEKKMKKRDSLIAIQKENILQQLEEVASLQEVYIKVLDAESKSTSTEISIGGEGFSLNKDKTQTREFDLLNTEMRLRNELKTLEEQKVEEDVFFDVIASFQAVGSNRSEWYERYLILFPILAFMLLSVIYLTNKTILFVKNYEA